MLLDTFASSILAHDISNRRLISAWRRAINGGYSRHIKGLKASCLTNFHISHNSIDLAFGTGVLGFLNDPFVHRLFDNLLKFGINLILVRERITTVENMAPE